MATGNIKVQIKYDDRDLMRHRKLIQQFNKEHPEDSMRGFFYFMIAVPFICIAGIAAAMHYSSKIDSIPPMVIFWSFTSLSAIFGVIWLINRAKN